MTLQRSSCNYESVKLGYIASDVQRTPLALQ